MSAAIAAASAAASCYPKNSKRTSLPENMYGGVQLQNQQYEYGLTATRRQKTSCYESLKQRDWNLFDRYRKSYKPVPLTLSRCSSDHVVEFLRCHVSRFGESEHDWASLNAVVGRLRVAYEENGGRPAMNPFGTPTVRLYLSQIKEAQAKARGVA